MIEKKNIIYTYILKVLVGEKGFRKKECDAYESGFGLYFSV